MQIRFRQLEPDLFVGQTVFLGSASATTTSVHFHQIQQLILDRKIVCGGHDAGTHPLSGALTPSPRRLPAQALKFITF